MVVSELQHKETLEQIIERANQEINSLLATDDQLRQQIVNCGKELSALNESEQEANNRLSALQAALDGSIQSYGEAKSYAELAVNTPGEKNAIIALKDAEKRKKEQEHSYASQKKKIGHELIEIPPSRKILQDTILSAKKSLFDHARKREYLTANRDKAKNDLGMLILSASKDRLSKLQDDLKEKQIELAAMEQELSKSVLEEAEKLVEYPEHANMIKSAIPFQDTTTRILEASRNLLALLLSEGTQVNIDPVLLRQVNGYASITDLLSWDIQMLESAVSGGSKRRLEERLHNLTWLLNQYREEKEKHV